MRILLVEDEEKVSRFVARGLVAERFAVDTARNGKAGLELAETYQYDLIILDLMLPELSGSDVLRRLRRSNSQVPVLIFNSYGAIGRWFRGTEETSGSICITNPTVPARPVAGF